MRAAATMGLLFRTDIVCAILTASGLKLFFFFFFFGLGLGDVGCKQVLSILRRGMQSCRFEEVGLGCRCGGGGVFCGGKGGLSGQAGEEKKRSRERSGRWGSDGCMGE